MDSQHANGKSRLSYLCFAAVSASTVRLTQTLISVVSWRISFLKLYRFARVDIFFYFFFRIHYSVFYGLTWYYHAHFIFFVLQTGRRDIEVVKLITGAEIFSASIFFFVSTASRMAAQRRSLILEPNPRASWTPRSPCARNSERALRDRGDRGRPAPTAASDWHLFFVVVFFPECATVVVVVNNGFGAPSSVQHACRAPFAFVRRIFVGAGWNIFRFEPTTSPFLLTIFGAFVARYGPLPCLIGASSSSFCRFYGAVFFFFFLPLFFVVPPHRRRFSRRRSSVLRDVTASRILRSKRIICSILSGGRSTGARRRSARFFFSVFFRRFRR